MNMKAERPKPQDDAWKPLGPDDLTPLLNDRDGTIRYIVQLEEALGLARVMTRNHEAFFAAVNHADPDLCGAAMAKAWGV